MSIEERRKEIQEIREAHKRLADIIVAGTEYHEPVTVKTVDKKEHSIEVYALSEKDLVEAFQAAGQDLKEIGNPDKLMSNLKLMGELAARATRQPDIGKIRPRVYSKKYMRKRVYHYVRYYLEIPKRIAEPSLGIQLEARHHWGSQ